MNWYYPVVEISVICETDVCIHFYSLIAVVLQLV